MILASVVFPEPGGPQKMPDPTSPRRISSPRAFPGPSRCSWPRNWSSVLGRIRAANGSLDPWNSVGSVTNEMYRQKKSGHPEGRPDHARRLRDYCVTSVTRKTSKYGPVFGAGELLKPIGVGGVT